MKHAISLILALTLLLALLTPLALGEAPENEIEAILSGMTLEEKVGQMMLVSFRAWKEVPEAGGDGDAGSGPSATAENAEDETPAVNVTELNDPLRECFANYHFGGAVLFAQNCEDAEQVLRLVADMQAANRAGGGLPLLVAADQEGGSINRLGFGTAGPGNMALAATGDAGNARTMAAIYGEEMGLLGINADFAPVMDVNSDPNNPVIGIRAFSDDAGVVSEFGGARFVLLSDNLPVDAARFQDADAIVCAYLSAGFGVDPTARTSGSENVGAFNANVPAALCAIFGDGDMPGRLPIRIPVLEQGEDATWRYGSQTLYERGFSDLK